MNKTPFLRYPLEGLPQPDVQRDISYREDGDDHTRMDIYRPLGEAPARGYPLVIFLHGGPLVPEAGRPWPKEWRVFQDYGRLAAANGLAAVVPNHRYAGYDWLVRAIDDSLHAARFVSKHGAEYGLDSLRLAIWAFSGAGMLLSPFLQGEIEGVKALAAFYPMFDLTHIEQARAAYSEEELIALSPLAQVDSMPDTLPLFLARAGLDKPGLNRALDSFVKEALYHNLELDVRNLPRAMHGFDMFDDSVSTKDTITRCLEFMEQHLDA